MADNTNPIAIIGIGCRLPGGANTPEMLWKMLAASSDAWTDVPESRFNWRSFFHVDPEAQGTHNHRGGHFLDQDISAFDADFFGVHPLEAKAMDPQQRIQLEVAYEALENAGIPVDKVRDTNTAVYVAVFSQDYAQMQHKDLDDMPKYHMTGTGNAIVSNRISYFFGLRGPSVSLDTGCSGSLVAIHQACQSLRSGECEMALAGGVNLLISPDAMIPMSLMHVLNPDGKCYSFDTKGSGYGRGEGAAMVVLKRLDDAVRDGDHIRAIIRNTGVNHDGKTPGITVPSMNAQQELIQSVYRSSGLDPSETSYIEAHGTGTVVGDREEIAAIQAVFDDIRTTPLYVGSVKPNIGHLESASGVAGLIKAVLVLENGMIPPNVNFDAFKSSLNLNGSRVTIPSRLEQWQEGVPKRVSVNSFGYGGTNAHAVLDGVSDRVLPNRDGEDRVMHGIAHHRTPQVLALSAKNEASLMNSIEKLRLWVSTHVDNAETDYGVLSDLAHTLTSRRSHMKWRYSFTAASLEEILLSLSQKARKPVRACNNYRFVFVFTGQGAQWFAMGRELLGYPSSPFEESIDRSNELLNTIGASWNLTEELLKAEEDSRVNESEIAQPATTAIQIALVDLLRHLGVQPDAVLGHSSGEICAAYAAGAITHTSALKIAYHRGVLAKRVARKGAMLAVGLGGEELSAYTSRLKKGVAVVACLNSPASSTVSGDVEAIAELKEILDTVDVFSTKLKIDVAYHSHHVKAIESEYLSALGELESGTPRASVKFISCVTAQEKKEGFGAEYWVQNLSSTVRFCDALRHLCGTLRGSSQSTLRSPTPIFVEVGPDRVLSGPARQSVGNDFLSSDFCYFSTFSKNRNAYGAVLELAGRLFERGCPIDLSLVNSLTGQARNPKVLHGLPPYAWCHSNTYWHESRLSKAHRFRQQPYHDLLGVRVVGSTTLEPVWRHIFSIDSLPWLQEHTIDGLVIFPGAAYISMAIEATRQLILERHAIVSLAGHISKYVVKDISFITPLVVPESSQAVEIQLVMAFSGKDDWTLFRVISVSSDGASVEHCRGLAMAVLHSSAASEDADSMQERYTVDAQVSRLESLRKSCSESVDCAKLYDDLRAKGNYYGPNYARVKELWVDNDKSSLGTVNIPDSRSCMPAKFSQPHVIHPTTLDALLHTIVLTFSRMRTARSVMATEIGELSISADVTDVPNSRLLVTTTFDRVESNSAAAEISVFQTIEAGNPELALRITDCGMRATGQHMEDAKCRRDMTYRMKWGLDVEHISSSLFKGDSLNEELVAEKKLRDLNRAAAVYIRDCLDNLSRYSPDNLFRKYFFTWMNEFQQSSHFRDLTAGISTPSDIKSVLDTARQLGVEGEMLCRVGEKLPDILTEKIEPLALMMEDDLVYRLYADDASIRCYSHMIRYLRYATFKNPNMTMLELGAGTGGATVHLLRALGSNGTLPIKRYDFTDVSTGFFERSRARLEKWDGYLRFKSLDIDFDPMKQGFTEGGYDLVIASNVMHVSKYINPTLARVRKLLKPGGKLLLIETTEVVPFYNSCVGVLPGWWAGVDDGRTNAPVLGVQKWNDALLRTGFDGIEILAKDYEGSAHRSAMLVSKAIVHEGNASTSNKHTEVKIFVCPSWVSRTSNFVNSLDAALRGTGLDVSVESLISANAAIFSDALYIVLDDGADPILTTDSDNSFRHIPKLLVNATRVLWISAQVDASATSNPKKGLITGVARVARQENPQLRLVTVDIQESITQQCAAAVSKIKDIVVNNFCTLDAMCSKELEYVYKDGQLWISRLIPEMKLNQRIRHSGRRIEMQHFHQSERPLKLQIHHSGLLENMRFADDDSHQAAPSDCDIEVHVKAFGVNFKDVIVALGQSKKPLPMSGEYAGTVAKVPSMLQDRFRAGDRVCGFGAAGYASRVRVNGLTTQRLPETMSFVTAASVVVAFCTAHHALVNIAKLQKGQSVLIHSAASGIGQAAVKIAQHAQADVFTTAGSNYKRRFLVQKYGISDDHTFSNRTGLFREGIQRLTNGRGVDVILNTLSGQLFQESWDCIAPFGTFVELGKLDPRSMAPMSMKPFDRNVTFVSMDLSFMQQHQPAKAGALLAEVLSKFEAGAYTPINPVTLKPLSEIDDAFRLMQSRNHIGKIVLEANSETMVKALSKPSRLLTLGEKATYLIAGGTGGLGFEIAQFLIERDAKFLVLFSRRGCLDPAKRHELENKIHPRGGKLAVFACDVSNSLELQEMISACIRTMPPIKGVIQASMVLQDRVLNQLDLKTFQSSLRPKVNGTQTLAHVLGLKGQQLDFFLMLSSGASIIGNLSQANYAAGNAFMDALANSTNYGNRFLTLNLGPVIDAGILASNNRLKQLLVRQGYILLEAKEMLAAIEYSLSEDAKSSESKQFVLGFDYRSLRESDNKYTAENPIFNHLQRSCDSQIREEGKAIQSVERAITSAESTEEMEDIVTEAVAKKVSMLIDVAHEEIDHRRRVIEFGLDSLVVVQLQNWIRQKFQAEILTSEILNSSHIISLAATIVSRSGLVGKQLERVL